MKNKSMILSLCLFIFINLSLATQAFGMPKPFGTQLVDKSTQVIADSQIIIHQYRSKLSQDQILSFYSEKLAKQNWSKMDMPMSSLGSNLTRGLRAYKFIKDDKILILGFSPLKAEGYVFYSISESKFPKIGGQQPLDMFKPAKPTKFMPLYPGLKQIKYSKTSTGVSAGYMVAGGVEAVKGFYVQKMPQKGWALIDERSMDSDGYDLSNLEERCPTCPKIPSQAQQAIAGIKMQGIILRFKKGSETCVFNITEVSMPSTGGLGLTSAGLGDTIITVIYNEGK